jgi:hypothetical protein
LAVKLKGKKKDNFMQLWRITKGDMMRSRPLRKKMMKMNITTGILMT